MSSEDLFERSGGFLSTSRDTDQETRQEPAVGDRRPRVASLGSSCDVDVLDGAICEMDMMEIEELRREEREAEVDCVLQREEKEASEESRALTEDG